RHLEDGDHQERMENSPDVIEPFEVPEPRPAGSRKPDLLGEIRDLPVVPDVAVRPRILRVAEDEKIEKAWDGGDGREGRGPRPVQRRRPGRDLLDRLRRPVLLFLVGEEARQQLHAVAASNESCTWLRDTASTACSRVSMCRSQSNRRAHSTARSPVAWFSSRLSSSLPIPSA